METIYPRETFHNVNNVSSHPNGILQYFAGGTVFITGASGFLGRLLVEKLLRTCRDLKRIYILMRPKKDKSCEKRFEEYFDNIIYDRLKREHPESMKKLRIITGDCGLLELGINEQDKQILISEVNCIFHVAATVRFDEKIKTAAYINVRGTSELLRMSRKIQNLTSFVYVSTAYAFCPQKIIEEVFYEPTISGEQLLNLVESFSEEQLQAMTPTLIGKWPNTYVFTKSIAESVIRKEGADLPVAIVRPSIVVATAKEPIPGWIDNFYGATGIIAGAGIGLIRTLHCKPHNLADLVPADYVINSFLAAAWCRANDTNCNFIQRSLESDHSTLEKSQKSDIPIYNYVSTPQQHFTWKQCLDMGFQRGRAVACKEQLWHPYILLISNKYLHLFFHYTSHLLPAYIVDFLATCLGKKPRLVKAYQKISKFLDVIAFFSTQEWTFGNQNTQSLWDKMNCEDQKAFEFDIGAFSWHEYFATYIPGIRVHLLKDSLDTVPQAVNKAYKMKIAHYLLVSFLLIGFVLLLLWVISKAVF